MVSKKKQNSLQFSLNDSFSFLDGLDISINLSIIAYLSSFFFPMLDTRMGIIVMSSIIVLSFTSRIFVFKILSLLEKIKLQKVNIYAILPVFYIPPLILQVNYPLMISILVFSISRVLIGFFFALSYRNVNVNDSILELNLCSVKYWVIYFIGLIFGFFCFNFLNEIYSNDFLNQGGWKLLYILIILLSAIFYIFSNFFLKKSIKFDFKKNIEKNLEKTNFSFRFSLILIPIISYILFVSSNWLPKFGNPENLHFLNYDFLYPFLTILLFIFLNPLSNLVGRKKSITFFCFTTIFISFLISFLNHNSSYSIDFLKFFIALISSFSISCFILFSEHRKMTLSDVSSKFNLNLFLLSLIIPVIFYYFIYFPINYSVIYIFLAMVYVICYSSFYRKNG